MIALSLGGFMIKLITIGLLSLTVSGCAQNVPQHAHRLHDGKFIQLDDGTRIQVYKIHRIHKSANHAKKIASKEHREIKRMFKKSRKVVSKQIKKEPHTQMRGKKVIVDENNESAKKIAKVKKIIKRNQNKKD